MQGQLFSNMRDQRVCDGKDGSERNSSLTVSVFKGIRCRQMIEHRVQEKRGRMKESSMASAMLGNENDTELDRSCY